MVAPLALAWNAEARHPAARSRLCAMAARVSQAAFAAKRPDGQMSQRPAGPVREDLLDHGVVAVLLLGLEHRERGVGEDWRGSARPGTARPGRGGLGFRSLTRRTISRAVMALPFFEANAV